MVVCDWITSFKVLRWLHALFGIETAFDDVDQFIDRSCQLLVAAEGYGFEFVESAAVFSLAAHGFG